MGLQSISSNKHTLLIFSNQPQTACYNRWLQQMLWNKHSALDSFIDLASSASMKLWRYHRKNGWLQLMSSNNRLLLIYAWNQGGIIISYYEYFVATVPVLQKHGKFERMCGCNCSFITERGSSIKRMITTGIAN